MERPSPPGRTIPINGIEMYCEVRGEGEPLLLLRGHGGSTNPSGEFTFRQCALDVFALLDRLGIDRFKAIGMSLGAKTLLHAATQQPARVEAMVLVSAAPYFPEQARSIMRQVSADNRTEAEWQQMRQWHRHGDRDPLYPVHLAMEMHSAIPRSYLWVVPNGGHGPIFGGTAAQFRETSLVFLRGEWEAA